jgi:hypothetical protein
MPRSLLLAVLAAALLGAGTAAAQGGLSRTVLVEAFETGPAEVELDGDPAPERVAVRQVSELRWSPRLEDDCPGVGTVRRRLGPTNDAVAIEAIEHDGVTMLFTSGSTGAAGRSGDFRLHRLGPETDARGCARLRTLFAYPTRSFRLPRPRRGTSPGSFSARIVVSRGRLTVRTYEGLYRRSDPGCCPSYLRTSDWRLNRRKDRFTLRRSRTTRTPRRGYWREIRKK